MPGGERGRRKRSEEQGRILGRIQGGILVRMGEPDKQVGRGWEIYWWEMGGGGGHWSARERRCNYCCTRWSLMHSWMSLHCNTDDHAPSHWFHWDRIIIRNRAWVGVTGSL